LLSPLLRSLIVAVKANVSVTDWGVLALLCLIAILGYLGQSLPAILLQPIKLEIGLSDATIGIVTGIGITVVGALAAFPIGLAADKFRRATVLAASVITWSIFVVVLAFAENTTGYATGLLGFNLGDAAMLPLIYAMVAARFHGASREWANAILVAVLLLSSSGIFALGGYLLNFFEHAPVFELSPWRAVCFCVAIVGPIVAAPLLFLRSEKAAEVAPLPLAEKEAISYGRYLEREGLYVASLMVAISVFYTAYSVFAFWLPSILERAFEFPAAEANIAIGQTMFGATLAGIGATLLFIPLMRRRWGHGAPLYLVIIGCSIVFIPACALLWIKTEDQLLALIACMSFGMTISMMLVPGLLQSCAPDAFRSRTIALFPILSAAMRMALPVLIGVFSTRYGEDGDTLLTIVSIMLLTCFALSIILLVVLAPRFEAFADRNLMRDASMPSSDDD
jgi:MFS family permease